MKKAVALFLTLTLASAGVFAQQRGDREPRGGGKNQGMSKDQRERMRQDMRNVYQDKGGLNRQQQQQRQMSPEEREKLRRDIQDANRNLRR
ncbi:MAG: hypothetical protein JO292_00095 [Betaproteobacteria bacterium]|nr:hypothetical protein [Betaproteobacteria bacterium]MBV9359763.1 hypothetical protein [Betaproteobacteria bacterium]